MPKVRSASSVLAAVVFVGSFMAAPASSQVSDTSNLGEVDFQTSCPEAARAPFNRAVALLHHMTYSGARAAFAAIASDYPTCAMAHWGVAMTLFQPLWPTRPGPQDLERGLQEVRKAREAGETTAREKLFIAAAAAFFDPSLTDYWDRIGKWAEASRAVYDAYPDDVEAMAMFALSHLATAPATGDMSHHETAAAVLADILSEHPTHPGAVHYTIHAQDAPGREHETPGVVRGYADIAPRNPHALHMPTHIYVRQGEWNDVVEGNIAAAQAALDNPAGDQQQWVWDEYPHAVEYEVYALLQLGDDAAALEAMTRLQAIPNLQPTFKTAFNLSSIPARYALERRAWAEAAQLEPRPSPSLPWDRFAWPEAVTWFARGMGAVRSGDVGPAREAEARLNTLSDVSAQAGEELFSRQIEILRLAVTAWIARSQGDGSTAVRFMREAVSLEAATPKHAVTPAPTLPANELLGDLLLESDNPVDALAAYEASLRSYPNRFNSLAGAARSAREAGNSALATRYYQALRTQAAPGSMRPELAEAEAYLRR